MIILASLVDTLCQQHLNIPRPQTGIYCGWLYAAPLFFMMPVIENPNDVYYFPVFSYF